MQQCQWFLSTFFFLALLVCMALHPQIMRRHCSKFSVTPLSIWTSQNSSTVSLLVVVWFTQASWEVARQLQLHCLSRLNLSRPRVCAFTYLFSSIFFMPNTSSYSRCCCSVECSCKSCMWGCQYTRIHGALGCTQISGTRVRQTQGKWYIDRYIHTYYYSMHGRRCHDQCGLAQAHPN